MICGSGVLMILLFSLRAKGKAKGNTIYSIHILGCWCYAKLNLKLEDLKTIKITGGTGEGDTLGERYESVTGEYDLDAIDATSILRSTRIDVALMMTFLTLDLSWE